MYRMMIATPPRAMRGAYCWYKACGKKEWGVYEGLRQLAERGGGMMTPYILEPTCNESFFAPHLNFLESFTNRLEVCEMSEMNHEHHTDRVMPQ